MEILASLKLVNYTKLLDVKTAYLTRSWMEDWELTTGTVNQEGLESSLSWCVAHAISMHQNERLCGKGGLICQYPHSIQPLRLSAQPSLQNIYRNMSRKYFVSFGCFLLTSFLFCLRAHLRSLSLFILPSSLLGDLLHDLASVCIINLSSVSRTSKML